MRVFDADGGGLAAGLARFEWDPIEWYEEDEPIVGHPRNPYVRVDALRSHRHVTVALDGVLLAETHCPVLLFETGQVRESQCLRGLRGVFRGALLHVGQ